MNQDIKFLNNKIRTMRQELAVRPIRTATRTKSQIIDIMWTIIGSNTIVSPATTGIRYVSTNVDPTTLPVPVIIPTPSIGDIVIVNAVVPPAGLPNGVGTARAIGSGVYSFVLNDPRNSSNHRDAWINDKYYAVDRVTLDKISAGVTYRYQCLQLGALI